MRVRAQYLRCPPRDGSSHSAFNLGLPLSKHEAGRVNSGMTVAGRRTARFAAMTLLVVVDDGVEETLSDPAGRRPSDWCQTVVAC